MLQSKSAMSFVAVFRGRASEHAIKHVPAGWQLKGREGIEEEQGGGRGGGRVDVGGEGRERKMKMGCRRRRR